MINEIFSDPGGDVVRDRELEDQLEYVELRGTPGMSLANIYLIFVENEDNLLHTGNAGIVENVFRLADDPNTPEVDPVSIGSNGFLTLRQKDNLYADPPAGTTDLVNTGSGEGWGSGSTSSVRHFGENGKSVFENSGFTAMLIRNNGHPVNNRPFPGLDLDVGNNGLDNSPGQFGWRDAWEILDSIGIHGEVDEENGRLYGMVNFGQASTANIEPGAEYYGGGYEIEMVARWGDSTGHTLADWHATNLSDRTVDGYFSASTPVNPDAVPPVVDYRQSGNRHNEVPDDFVETNQYVPYGTPLTTTLGAPNYPLNLEHLPWDYNHDGTVNAADYTVWRDTLGQTGLGLAADGDGSGTVGMQDYQWWKARFGYSWNNVPGYIPPLGSGGMSVNVPEPATFALLVLGALFSRSFRFRLRVEVDSR